MGIGKLMVRLDEFVVHLKASMQDLIQAEIRAGRDTVTFIQESEKETHILQVEMDRYVAYAAKLENDIVLAKDMEAKVELQEHRDWYMSEVDRLRNDVEVVDDVISIF